MKIHITFWWSVLFKAAFGLILGSSFVETGAFGSQASPPKVFKPREIGAAQTFVRTYLPQKSNQSSVTRLIPSDPLKPNDEVWFQLAHEISYHGMKDELKHFASIMVQAEGSAADRVYRLLLKMTLLNPSFMVANAPQFFGGMDCFVVRIFLDSPAPSGPGVDPDIKKLIELTKAISSERTKQSVEMFTFKSRVLEHVKNLELLAKNQDPGEKNILCPRGI
jgi:hypothetical protein